MRQERGLFMASFFSLQLDTTAPQIEIVAPSYTVYDEDNYIEIRSNEQLDQWQEIYIVDAAENRYDFTFLLNEDRTLLTGVVVFPQTMSSGIATMYARVRDEVFNVSLVASKTINIFPGLKIKINITTDSFIRDIDALHGERNMFLTDGKTRTIRVGAINDRSSVG
jgi:hypothetical protein